jgi:predicted PhzF superfamily epimerase YddE/YHI9
LTWQEVPICGHATLAASKVVLSRYPHLSEIKFETRFWGELTAKKRDGGIHDENSLEVTISLSTLSPEALSKFTETSAQQLAEHRRDIADTLQIKEEQVIAAGEYQFVEKSLIIELAPEVDLAALKLDPKAVVCYIIPVISGG